MILMSRIIKPIDVRVVRTGDVIQLPAGGGGAFIVHRDQPVIFFFNDEMCELSMEAFCHGTGKTLDSLECLFALDCDDDEYDDSVLEAPDEEESSDDQASSYRQNMEDSRETKMDNDDGVARTVVLDKYRAYFTVIVYAASEKEAMNKGFEYLAAFYGDANNNDDEIQTESREVCFDHAELIHEAGQGETVVEAK